MGKIRGYLKTIEIMKIFNWGRAQTSATARREKWKREQVGTSFLYHEEEIYKYRDTRFRTQLLKKANWWTGPGLYRDSDIDIICPICESFAVKEPKAGDEWICLKNHTGYFEED